MHDSVLVFYHLTDRIKIRKHTVLEQSLRIADVDHAVAVEVNIAGIVDRVEVRQHAVLEQKLGIADVNGGVGVDVAREHFRLGLFWNTDRRIISQSWIFIIFDFMNRPNLRKIKSFI